MVLFLNSPLHINTIMKHDVLEPQNLTLRVRQTPYNQPKTHKEPVPGYAWLTNAIYFYHPQSSSVTDCNSCQTIYSESLFVSIGGHRYRLVCVPMHATYSMCVISLSAQTPQLRSLWRH